MTSARQIFEITGSEAESFLQGLVTNDMAKLSDGLVYAALLNPQGKYLADFFMCKRGDVVLLDIASQLAAGVAKRLGMYKLRADVTISASELHLVQGLGDRPEDALNDPRHPDLGWRAYRDAPEVMIPSETWDALRVAHAIPETGIELVPDETYILEAGFERLNGVDFRKGCYVGQEVTARMKHKTQLRKGLAQVSVEGQAPVGTAITANEKPVGVLFTQSEGQALAHLRFDRANAPMQADDATVTYSPNADNTQA